MTQFLPPEYDLHRIRAALAQGVPVKVRHNERDLPLYYVQVGDGAEPALHCTAQHDHTGVDYTLVLPLDATAWAALMAQLPDAYR